jgi:hypothetical protein
MERTAGDDLIEAAKIGSRPMHTAAWYRKKAEECVSRAKTATKNEDRARNWALAEHYTRLAMDQLIPR